MVDKPRYCKVRRPADLVACKCVDRRTVIALTLWHLRTTFLGWHLDWLPDRGNAPIVDLTQDNAGDRLFYIVTIIGFDAPVLVRAVLLPQFSSYPASRISHLSFSCCAMMAP